VTDAAAAESQHTEAVSKVQDVTARRLCERDPISLATLPFINTEMKHEFADSAHLSLYILRFFP
jgi:hypothetical protein